MAQSIRLSFLRNAAIPERLVTNSLSDMPIQPLLASVCPEGSLIV